eukprot:g855.t1
MDSNVHRMFAKVAPFLFQEFSCPQRKEEKLGIDVSRPKNIRQALGFDIYEAHGLIKQFKAKSLAKLCIILHDEKEALIQSGDYMNMPNFYAEFEQRLKRAIYSSSKAHLLYRLLDHVVEDPARVRSLRIQLEEYEKAEKENEDEDEDEDEVESKNGDESEEKENHDDPDGQEKEMKNQEEKETEQKQQEVQQVEEKADEGMTTFLTETSTLTDYHDADDSRMVESKRKSSDGYQEFIAEIKLIKAENILKKDKLPLALSKYQTYCAKHNVSPISQFAKCINTNSTSLNLDHYGISYNGLAALFLHGLKFAPKVKELYIADNWIGNEGAVFVAHYLKSDNHLTALDLGYNQIGREGIEEIINAISHNTSLLHLCLAGNDMDDVDAVLFVENGLRHNTTLTTLDLSKNLISDQGATALGRLMLRQGEMNVLSDINLSWNNIGPEGAVGFAKGLKMSKTLANLDLGWNVIGDVGAMSIGLALSKSASVTSLNLSQNDIGFRGACILSEAIRQCKSLAVFDCNDNPLGKKGSQTILLAVEYSSHLKHAGVRNVKCDPLLEIQRLPFDLTKPSGTYDLNLALYDQYATAELLRTRALNGEGKWLNAALNGAVFSTHARLPKKGRLTFMFQATKELEKSRSYSPSTHFCLNLAYEDERKICETLMRRAVQEPGENWYNEMLDGKPFDFVETAQNVDDFLENNTNGVLDVDYVSTSLKYEKHYVLRLNNKADHAQAEKLLERVYISERDAEEEKRCPDTWINSKFNHRAFELASWLRKAYGHKNMKHTSSKNKWRIPPLGLLEFDYISSNPQHMCTLHFELDLGVDKDRAVAVEMRNQALTTPGENWWNESIDGLPFQLNESIFFDAVLTERVATNSNTSTPDQSPTPSPSATPKLSTRSINSGTNASSNTADGGGARRSLPRHSKHRIRAGQSVNAFPTKGILIFDYVVCKPKQDATFMERETLLFNLELRREREIVNIMLARMRRIKDEYWVNTTIDGIPLPANEIMDSNWEVPRKAKKISFDVVSFHKHNVISVEAFENAIGEIANQRNDAGRLHIVQSLCRGNFTIEKKYQNIQQQSYGDGNNTELSKQQQQQQAEPTVYFSAAQIHKILKYFRWGDEKSEALRILTNVMIDQYNAYRVLEDVIEEEEEKQELRKWTLCGAWK